MKRTQRTSTVAAATWLAILALGHQGAAQADPGAGRQPPGPHSQVVSVDFRGGTLAEYAAALREAGEHVNILLPENASRVELPAITLRRASVENALNAVRSIVSPDCHVDVQTQRAGPGEAVHAVRVLVPESAATQATGGRRGARGAPSAPSVAVFSLRGLTETLPGEPEGLGYTADTILTAVKTGIDLADEAGPAAVLRYHEDSGLLFLRGSQSQLSLGHETLNRLKEHLVQQRAMASRGTRRGGTATKAGKAGDK